MSRTETWTVKRLLEWTSDFFSKKGLDSPRLEAEILLAKALNMKRIELYTNFDAEPDEGRRTQFREFVKRRGAGEPVAYLVGFKEFFSLPFKVDRNVLIPRPETEQLVLEALDWLKTAERSFADVGPRICDVGTGSGAIAVAMAKNWPGSSGSGVTTKIVATDINPVALEIARQNAKTNGVGDRIEFVESDLLEAVAGPFDLIVSNPPYVSAAEYEALPVDVKNFEPKSALLAGPNGTEIIERLIAQAGDKLKSGGRLLVEGSPMIADRITVMLGRWNNVRILKDDGNRPRFVVATKD